MKGLIIVLLIFVVAVFTGTWIFGGLEWIFNGLGSICSFLSDIFDLFGWNAGIL